MSNSELLKIGVQLQTHVVAPRRYVEVVHEALNLGVDSVFLWDHLVPFTGKEGDVAWETWSLLGSVARTSAVMGDVELYKRTRAVSEPSTT